MSTSATGAALQEWSCRGKLLMQWIHWPCHLTVCYVWENWENFRLVFVWYHRLNFHYHLEYTRCCSGIHIQIFFHTKGYLRIVPWSEPRCSELSVWQEKYLWKYASEQKCQCKHARGNLALPVDAAVRLLHCGTSGVSVVVRDSPILSDSSSKPVSVTVQQLVPLLLSKLWDWCIHSLFVGGNGQKKGIFQHILSPISIYLGSIPWKLS